MAAKIDLEVVSEYIVKLYSYLCLRVNSLLNWVVEGIG